jgi:hypothetical protein
MGTKRVNAVQMFGDRCKIGFSREPSFCGVSGGALGGGFAGFDPVADAVDGASDDGDLGELFAALDGAEVQAETAAAAPYLTVALVDLVGGGVVAGAGDG